METNIYVELKKDEGIKGTILKEKKNKVLLDTTEGIFWISKKELKKDWKCNKYESKR